MSEFDDAVEPTETETDATGTAETDADATGTAETDAHATGTADARLSDTRADVPISVVAERFLRALIAQVPPDRIEELYLFAPLRQGTVETGIAVVAARVILPPEPVADEAPLELQLAQNSGAESMEPPAERSGADAGYLPAQSSDADAAEPAVGSSDADAVETVADGNGADTIELHDDWSPYAPDVEPEALDIMPVFASTGEAVEIAAYEPVAPPRVRHTVYTARYRLVIKGPDRGKWEFDVVDEADAPLLTVEMVVRGVQRRAGEDTATVRYDSAQLARVLRLNT